MVGRCVEAGLRVGGGDSSLAVFDGVTDKLYVDAILTIHLPTRCVWVGMQKQYLYWTTPTSKLPHTR